MIFRKIFDELLKRIMYLFKTEIKNRHLYAFLEYNSMQKFINFLKIEWVRFSGKTHNFGYPYLLTVEPTNVCNLKCPLCKTGKGLVGRDKQFMNIEKYKTLIEEIGEYLYVINFYNWGEPFLHKDVFEMIAYAHKKRIYTTVSTHGNYKSDLNDKILDSGLDLILFALDGSNSEIYSQYRVGGSFDLVVGNIKDLVSKKKKNKKIKPFIELQFLVFEHNENDIDNFKKLAKSLDVDGILIRAGTAPGDEKMKRKHYSWSQRKGMCRRLWYTAIVNCDGGVNPCCLFFNKEDDFGNAFDKNFAAVWNNETYVSSRRCMIRADKNKINKICRNCKYLFM